MTACSKQRRNWGHYMSQSEYVSPVQQTQNRINALLAKIDAVLEGYAEHRAKITEGMGGTE